MSRSFTEGRDEDTGEREGVCVVMFFSLISF